MSYNYLLFDWDGTLAKTFDIWLDALRASLQAHGHMLDDLEIGANYADFKTRYESKNFTNLDAILKRAMIEADNAIPSVSLYPGVRKTLNQLRQAGKQIALVTTSEHQQIDPLLAKHNLESLFDVVVCADDTTQLKPHPEPLQKAMQLLKAQPYETLMIGDSDNDLVAATKAGVDSVLFYPPAHRVFHNLETLTQLQPTYIIGELAELINL